MLVYRLPVEEPKGGYLLDEVVGEDELGGGGGDLHGDLLQVPVGAVHSRLVAVAACRDVGTCFRQEMYPDIR